MTGYIAELRADAEAVRTSNLPGFGRSAEKIVAALDDLEATTAHMQLLLAEGRMQDALAGATPYLRLFALAAGAACLGRGAAATKEAGRVALCRFFAENLAGETAALKERVVEGAESLAEAAKGLG